MNKKILAIVGFIAIGICSFLFASSHNKYANYQDGDMIFQVTNSSQCEAIQHATKSEYTHCGIIFKQDGQHFVYEAAQPVCITPLDKWIERGIKKHYVVKRLKDADKILTNDVKNKMFAEAKKHMGKNYDLTFEWSDSKIYCSELIWKIYKRGADVEVGKLEKLSELDLTHPAVKKKMKERYGDNVPMNETVISPASIFDCELLYTVN